MILCSCNLITDNNVRQIMESRPSYARLPSVEEIMEKHGCSIVCATCVRNLKIEIRKHYNACEDRTV